MLSPQTTGVELPWWASGTFHFTFSLPLHLRGTFFSSHWPCPVGPRQAGQLSARATAASASAARTAEQTAARADGMGRLRGGVGASVMIILPRAGRGQCRVAATRSGARRWRAPLRVAATRHPTIPQEVPMLPFAPDAVPPLSGVRVL